MVPVKPRQLHFFGIKKTGEAENKKEGIVVPVDTSILLSVVFILLFALVFSWGVERGRNLARENLPPEKEKTEAEQTEKMKAKPASLPETKQSLPEQTRETVKEKSEPSLARASERKTKPQPDKVLYRIQVASFRTSSSAQKEAEKLKSRGFPVNTNQSGNYAVVYVGNFKERSEAEAKLKKLKNLYPDCILRKINQ